MFQELAECKCPKILSVDDDEFNLLVMTSLLKSLGHETITANNGKRAIEVVQ